jgi:hypothetical protein
MAPSGPTVATITLGVGVLNATINTISAISWRSVLLVEDTEVHMLEHVHVYF